MCLKSVFYQLATHRKRLDLSHLRQEYSNQKLDVDSVEACPFDQFELWFDQAKRSELCEPNAMALATVDSDGRPSIRTVLLKYLDRQGFVFFTNYQSRKAMHLERNQNVSLLFQWLPLSRQVEISGTATKISKSESLQYFLKRPYGSQLGAWVSTQSQVISARSLLEEKLAELKRKFAEGSVPLPSFWGGYRIRPRRFEFWQGGPSRLHDRIEYLPADKDEQAGWSRNRLSP